MTSIPQSRQAKHQIKQEKITAEFRERVLRYAEKHGVSRASYQFHVNPKTLYRWRARWLQANKSLESLYNGSRRPHSHPSHHTEAELTWIKNLKRRNPRMGLQDLWIRLKENYGYTRSLSGLQKVLRCLYGPSNIKSLPSPTCKRKPAYPTATHPGQKVQIDVKYVPTECLAAPFRFNTLNGSHIYQYTAIDEYSRYRILGGYREHNSYSSGMFLAQVYSGFKALGVRIECVQTDNGAEFTTRLVSKTGTNTSYFMLIANRLNIQVKHIRPATPKHNGKVERSHREDQKLFYSEIVRTGKLITSMKDFQQRLKRHQDRTNHRKMRPLDYLSPIEAIALYQAKHKKKSG